MPNIEKELASAPIGQRLGVYVAHRNMKIQGITSLIPWGLNSQPCLFLARRQTAV